MRAFVPRAGTRPPTGPDVNEPALRGPSLGWQVQGPGGADHRLIRSTLRPGADAADAPGSVSVRTTHVMQKRRRHMLCDCVCVRVCVAWLLLTEMLQVSL